MIRIVLLLLLKLVTLGGSIATTAAVLGLFFFKETLGPQVVPLAVGGIAAIIIGEAGAWLLGRFAAADAPDA